MRKWRKRLTLCSAVALVAGLPYAYHLPALRKQESFFSIEGTDAAHHKQTIIPLPSQETLQFLSAIKEESGYTRIQESPNRTKVSFCTPQNGEFRMHILTKETLEEQIISLPHDEPAIIPLWINDEKILVGFTSKDKARYSDSFGNTLLELSFTPSELSYLQAENLSILDLATKTTSHVSYDDVVKTKETRGGAVATFGLALLASWLLSKKKHSNVLTCFGKHPYIATLAGAVGGALFGYQDYLRCIISGGTLDTALAQQSFMTFSSAAAGNALSVYLGSKEGGHLKNIAHGFGGFFSRRHRQEMRVYERPFKVESDRGIRPLLARNTTGFLPSYRAFKADLLRLRDLPILAEIAALLVVPINYALCSIFPKSYSPKEHPGRAVERILSFSIKGIFDMSNQGYNSLCLEHVPAEYKAAGAMLLAALNEQRALLEECFPFAYSLQNRTLKNNCAGNSSVFATQANDLWRKAIPEFLKRGKFRQLDVYSKSEVLDIPANEFLSAALRFLRRPSSEAPQLEAALTNATWYEERLPSQIVVPIYFTPDHDGFAYLVSCYAGITLEEKLEQGGGARDIESCAELLWKMREHNPPKRIDPRYEGHSKRRLEDTILKYFSSLKAETRRALLEAANVTDEYLADCSPIAYRDATHRNWLFEKMLDGTEILRANDLEGATMLPPTIDDVNLYESGPCLTNEQIELLVKTGGRKLGRDEEKYLREYFFTVPQRCLELVGFRLRDAVAAREKGSSDANECKLARHNAARAEFYAQKAYDKTQDERWRAYANAAREIQEILR